jgi:hypothetical protein
MPMTDNEEHGNVLIKGLWARGTDCILDVRVVDTNTPTYQTKDPIKVLEASESMYQEE